MVLREAEPCGFTEHIVAEEATRIAAAKIIEYSFDGSEIDRCEGGGLLRWRLAPEHVRAAYRVGGRGDFSEIGKLMYLPAEVPFQARHLNKGDKTRSLVCVFAAAAEDKLMGKDGGWSDAQLNSCYDITCARAELGMQRLTYELTHPGFASTMLIDGLLQTLAIDMGRYMRREGPVLFDGDRTRPLSQHQLRQVTEFIHAARGGCPTTEQLAAVCQMNASTFRRRFKLTTGQSVHAYVEVVRLERAKSLLVGSELLMKEITYELGFTHQATFTASFRRHMNMSPSEYREAYRV